MLLLCLPAGDCSVSERAPAPADGPVCLWLTELLQQVAAHIQRVCFPLTPIHRPLHPPTHSARVAWQLREHRGGGGCRRFGLCGVLRHQPAGPLSAGLAALWSSSVEGLQPLGGCSWGGRLGGHCLFHGRWLLHLLSEREGLFRGWQIKRVSLCGGATSRGWRSYGWEQWMGFLLHFHHGLACCI